MPSFDQGSRTLSIVKALQSGLALRGSGVFFNLLFVPIAIGALELDLYGYLATVLGLASWLSIASLGMRQTTAMRVAGLPAKDEACESVILVRAFSIVVICIVCAQFLYVCVARTLLFSTSSSLANTPALSIVIALVVSSICYIITSLSSPFEGLRIGKLESDYCNRVRFIAQLIAIFVLLGAPAFPPAIPVFAFIALMAPVLASCWFLLRGAPLVNGIARSALSYRNTWQMAKEGGGYAASSIAVLFLGGASLPLFVSAFGERDLATAAVISRVIQLYFSLLAVFLIPFSAALKSALSIKDLLWIKSALSVGAASFFVTYCVATIILGLWGEWLITAWTSTRLPNLGYWIHSCGVLMGAITWVYFWVYVAFALFGASLVARLAVIEIGFTSFLYFLLSNAVPSAASLLISSFVIVLISGVVLPLKALQELRHLQVMRS
ncbi:MAG: hypothetical protein AAGI24_11030 [Pseudomonadota bacterium]